MRNKYMSHRDGVVNKWLRKWYYIRVNEKPMENMRKMDPHFLRLATEQS